MNSYNKLKISIKQFSGTQKAARCKLTIHIDKKVVHKIVVVVSTNEDIDLNKMCISCDIQTINEIVNADINTELDFIYKKAQEHRMDLYGIDVYWKWDNSDIDKNIPTINNNLIDINYWS